ncbi:hypothetical protein Anapl_06716 [Anas platyrhynchos]|uniref:Uncharacterized protein n=1 Tax=Anas platyrhynchos TaxID=8839 RepID=R0K944_ANAPL|nr:hypothetical protein Anapl_06716 [Anas platyrhynchos]
MALLRRNTRRRAHTGGPQSTRTTDEPNLCKAAVKTTQELRSETVSLSLTSWLYKVLSENLGSHPDFLDVLVCCVEITRQNKPGMAETVRSRTANSNQFRSVFDLNEVLIGTVYMDNSFWIQLWEEFMILLLEFLHTPLLVTCLVTTTLQGWRAERTRGPGTELCMLFFPTPLSLHGASFMVQIHLTAFQHLESDMFVLESLYRQQEEIAASSKQFS